MESEDVDKYMRDFMQAVKWQLQHLAVSYGCFGEGAYSADGDLHVDVIPSVYIWQCALSTVRWLFKYGKNSPRYSIE